MNRWIARITSWWLRAHPPLARIPAWKAAQEAEKRARQRNDCRAIHRALRAKQAAILDDLRGAV